MPADAFYINTLILFGFRKLILEGCHSKVPLLCIFWHRYRALLLCVSQQKYEFIMTIQH